MTGATLDPRPSAIRRLRERQAAWRAKGLQRTRKLLETPQGVEVIVDGRRLVNFSSNDYLGLANHPQVIAALQQGAERYGVGAGASHLVCGHSRAHHRLEEELADFTGRDRVLLFSSGYLANLGVIPALTGRHGTVFEDRLNHASLLDAARLAGARLLRYPHRDGAALERALADSPAVDRMIATDGVFSMDGDIAPLVELASTARRHDAWLMVDDAHGFGVLGPEGRGSTAELGLTQNEVPILLGTLGKAFGTFGAFVAGSAELIEFLLQQARTTIYTTALPPAVAEATRCALRLSRTETWRRARLTALIEHFREGARQLALPLLPSNSPIQPVLIGDNEAVTAIGERLLEAGFLTGVIRPPTVPPGSARLRITLSANHGFEHVDRLLDTLAGLRAAGPPGGAIA